MRKTLPRGAVRQAPFAGGWAPGVAAGPEAMVMGWRGELGTRVPRWDEAGPCCLR